MAKTSPPWNDHLQTRTTERVKVVFDRIALELRPTALRFWSKRVSKEAFFNALVLWLEQIPPEQLAADLEKPMRRLEELMGYAPEAKPFVNEHRTLRPDRKKKDGRRKTAG